MRHQAKAWSARTTIRASRVSLLALCLLGIAFFLSPQAFAINKRVLTSSFGSFSSPPAGIAINQTTGHVYVVEGSTVWNFDASGTLDPVQPKLTGTDLGSIQDIEIDNSAGPNAGTIYVSAEYPDPGENGVKEFNSSGIFTGNEISFEDLPPDYRPDYFRSRGLAVDGSGNIYQTDYRTFGVNVFDSSQNFIKRFVSFHFSDTESVPAHMAVDSKGNVYAASNRGLRKYDPSGNCVDNCTLSADCVNSCTLINVDGTSSVAIDDEDNVYTVRDPQNWVGEARSVFEYSPSGALIQEFGTEDLGFTRSFPVMGLAVRSDTHDVYAVDINARKVRVFNYRDVAKVENVTATPLNPDKANLAAHVDPDGAGEVIGCRFEYVDDSEYETSRYAEAQVVPCDPTIPYATPVDVNAGIPGLDADTKYHYRLIVENGNGADHSLDQTFTMPEAVAGLTTGPAEAVQPNHATLTGSFTGDGNDTHYYFEYGVDESYGEELPAPPGADAGSAVGDQAVAPIVLDGLQASTTYHYRIVASNLHGTTFGEDQTFTTSAAVADLLASAIDIDAHSATLIGSFTGDGQDTHYYFEYGTDATYGTLTAPPPGGDAGSGVGPQQVEVEIDDLQPGVTLHFRIVASNGYGTTVGQDETFTTFKPPSISAVSSSGLQATTADLSAEINPEGAETTYHFEYGTTSGYGTTTAEKSAGGGSSAQTFTEHLTELQVGVTYHFRVIAQNQYGTTVSKDQTFNFYPPQCPNALLRQQTSAGYLPDCRAYELVSPADAGGTSLFSSGPNSGQATNPSRLSFTGTFGFIPGAGAPANTIGDLYVATRTSEGWVTKYIGLPGDQAAVMAGPPLVGNFNYPDGAVDKSQDGVLTNPAMSQFVDWNNGNALLYASAGNVAVGDRSKLPVPSRAPYAWNANGSFADRWPTNVSEVPGGEHFSGAVAASEDLTHFVFSSRDVAFAPEGTVGIPGSAYDNDVKSGSVSVISKTPAGDDIPRDPGSNWIYEYIQLPAVSADGSHILMATGTTIPPPPYPLESCNQPAQPTNGYGEKCSPSKDIHLYMRVNGAITYDISGSHSVRFLGATKDLSKVYFTAAGQLTSDDTDTSVDLYMWSEAGNAITRVSKGKGPTAGNADNCSASWVAKCGVGMFSDDSYAKLHSNIGGNGYTDSAVATISGDVYFYSPEQLDGAKGLNGEQNLYVFRNGEVQFVTTLTPGQHCTADNLTTHCSDGPLIRLQVSPDGEHMAFVTPSQLTPYDNAGHTEMYSYEPSTGKIVCVSCIPSGNPPTSDVWGSFDGLYMTNDGRTFFSTADPLVPRDTNEVRDVYEYVDGQAQLISSGTGVDPAGGLSGALGKPGLNSVSANGLDVYFSSLDTLVPQDRNGIEVKFYDARTNGGFPFTPPSSPCEAADECHGPGSNPPVDPQIRTGAALGPGGNAAAKRKGKKKAQKKRKRAKRQQQRRHRNG